MREQTPEELKTELNRTGVNFLLTDALVGHTLLDAAETTSVPENRNRRVAEAHKAYETIQHLLTKLAPDQDQQEELASRMATLRQRLSTFGVNLPDVEMHAG